MTTKYAYALLRFVPDPIKGEFVNIGIIAGSEEEDRWEIRTIERAGRATQLAAATSRGAWPAVMSELGSLHEQLADYSERTEGLRGGEPGDRLSREWLERLSASSRSVLQVSPVGVTLAESVDDAVESLWPILIAESTERKQVVRKSMIRGKVATRFRDYYRNLGADLSQPVDYHVDTRLSLQAGGTDANIDVVAYNGKAAQLTQCYSFDVNDLSQLKHDVKAWGWTVRDLRENGGNVRAHGRSVPVDRDVPVGVAYFLPTSPSDEAQSAFDYAKTVFESEGVNATLATSDHIETLLTRG